VNSEEENKSKTIFMYNEQQHFNRPPQTIIVKQNQTNGMGVAGFILAVLAILLCWIPILGQILWFLGLLFSFIGLFKNPKSFAIAGLIISLIGVVIFVLAIVFFAAFVPMNF